MNAEKLLDAMQYLPDEMLEQTDRLRRRKRQSWQPWVAVAACLCLLISAAWGMMDREEKGNDGAAPEANFGDMPGILPNYSMTGTSTGCLVATVNAVEADRLTVTLGSGEQALVLLTQVEEPALYKVGQKLFLYLDPGKENDSQDITQAIGKTLTPYKIEIKEDTP